MRSSFTVNFERALADVFDEQESRSGINHGRATSHDFPCTCELNRNETRENRLSNPLCHHMI